MVKTNLKPTDPRYYLDKDLEIAPVISQKDLAKLPNWQRNLHKPNRLYGCVKTGRVILGSTHQSTKAYVAKNRSNVQAHFEVPVSRIISCSPTAQTKAAKPFISKLKKILNKLNNYE